MECLGLAVMSTSQGALMALRASAGDVPRPSSGMVR